MDPNPTPDQGPTPDPDPNPDLTPFFSDFKDAKQFFFHLFFLKLTRRHIIFSLKNFIFC
jgi:hypothetical protein